jgi:hypothetical protein
MISLFRPARIARASVVLAVSLAYLWHLFQISAGTFWSRGLGDWLDPYFINALLEHWYHSVSALADPSSPPMYFPARHAIGYSHGLILYGLFYVPLRLVLHPFRAYTVMLCLVLETGIAALYLLFRRIGLAFVEALVLTALFFSSPNVVGGATGAWSQRASVFLIPQILLAILASFPSMSRSVRLGLAFGAGLFGGLMYVQDFYTAHLAVLFALLFGLTFPAASKPFGLSDRIARFWSAQSRMARWLVVIAALAWMWTCVVIMSGGVQAHLFGLTVRSHDWRRPALVAVLLSAPFVSPKWILGLRRPYPAIWNWCAALGMGASVGALIFLWMYLPAFHEHSAFPAEQVWQAVVPVHRVMDLFVYQSQRIFYVVLAVAALACMPFPGTDRKVRFSCLWMAVVAVVVLLVPVRVHGWSIWSAIARWPGFGVIRDPKRIIQVYELAAVLGVALIVRRLSSSSRYRAAVLLVCLAALVTQGANEAFEYGRPIAEFDRWVSAPIEIDPSCRCFFMGGASADYMSRSDHMWSLYGVDALFVSFAHSIPTLNGYSAWAPDDWGLYNPQEAGYRERVRRWVARNGLTGVCELDIDARKMTPIPGQ